MRKFAFGLALVFAIGLIAVPAMAEDEGKFTADGDVRLRWEYYGNYQDASDDGSSNDSFDAFPYRARLGVEGRFTDRAWGRVDLQAAGWFGDQLGNGGYPYPGSFGSSFVGGTQPYGAARNIGFVSLYQAFVTVEGGTFDFTAGRKEHAIGNELILGNNDFYNGLAFDGITLNGDFSSWDLNLWYHQLAETFSNREDVGLFGVDAAFEFGSFNFAPYVVYSKSHWDGLNTSTLPGGIRPVFLAPKHDLWTLGVIFGMPGDEDHTGIDFSVELAGQMGETDIDSTDPTTPAVDLKGYIFEGWFGFGFGGAGRIHIGTLYASGDDGTGVDANDNPNELTAWVPLFEDPHAMNRLGDLDLFSGFAIPGGNVADPLGFGMSNIWDINLGYDWWGGEKHHAKVAVHYFTRPEVANFGDSDPLAPGIQEYSDSIGTELDISYDYQYARNSKLEIGVATLFAGDFIKEWTSTLVNPGGYDDNITRIWAQLHLNWGK